MIWSWKKVSEIVIVVSRIRAKARVNTVKNVRDTLESRTSDVTDEILDDLGIDVVLKSESRKKIVIKKIPVST